MDIMFLYILVVFDNSQCVVWLINCQKFMLYMDYSKNIENLKEKI